MKKENILQPDSQHTLIVLPQSELDKITTCLNEVKQLILGKAAQQANSDWIDSNEARKLLGISAKTWQTYRDARLIPFSQFGRKIYVKREDIDAFFQSHSIRKHNQR